MTEIIQDAQTYLLPTYARPNFVLERGEGVYLYDTTGRRYLDFVAGIAVNALGYGDAEVIETLVTQAQKLLHVSNLYHTEPSIALAKRLISLSPAFARVFFTNSGAEAVEAAIKVARKYAREQHGEGKTTFVAFESSFHGRTMGALALTAREKYRLPFMPLMPNVRFAAFNDTDSLEATMGDDVCALIIEPVQGEGGLQVASNEFLNCCRTLCNKHQALLLADEIQCGLGRTGTLWAYEQTQIQPDLLTTAKPLAGGLPLGALLTTQAVANVIHPGDHGTTFGGGPLVTAVAEVVLRRISAPPFLAHIQAMSLYFEEALQRLAQSKPAQIKELRGKGLMRGFQVNGSAAIIREKAQAVGLLVATAGEDVIRLLPPLIIQPEQIDEALEKFQEIL